MPKITDEKGCSIDALAGLDRQVDASIWLASDLLPANCFTDELGLELAGGENAGAVLAPNERGPVANAVRLRRFRHDG